MALGALDSIPDTDGGGWKSSNQAFHSGMWWEAEKQLHNLKHKRLMLEMRRSLFPMRSAQQQSGGPDRLGCLPHWEGFPL